MHFVFKQREKRKGWHSERNPRDLPEETAQTKQQKRQHFHAAATTGDRAALQTPRSLGGLREVGGQEGQAGGGQPGGREGGQRPGGKSTPSRRRGGRGGAQFPPGNRFKGFSVSTIKKKKWLQAKRLLIYTQTHIHSRARAHTKLLYRPIFLDTETKD